MPSLPVNPNKYDGFCLTSLNSQVNIEISAKTSIVVVPVLQMQHILLSMLIFGPGRRVPKATLVVVVISSLKIPTAFLIHSGAQRNFAYTFMLIFPRDYRLRFLN